VVNNVETLAALLGSLSAARRLMPPLAQRKARDEALSVSGHIAKPGVYELEMGYPFKKFLEEDCVACRAAKNSKA